MQENKTDRNQHTTVQTHLDSVPLAMRTRRTYAFNWASAVHQVE